MLDKLIESKNNGSETRKVRKLFLTTSTVIISTVFFALIFSLFAQNLAMGQESIELSNLLSPVKIPENAPIPQKPVDQTKQTNQKDNKTNLTTRKENIMRVDESPRKIPQTISTTVSDAKSRPNSAFEVGLKDSDKIPTDNNSKKIGNTSNPDGEGFKITETPTKPVTPKEPIKKIEMPELPPPPQEKRKKAENIIVSTGVVNGKAVNLVKPAFPASAKSIQLRGQVTVQVLIDENGKVVSAQTIKGHQLFRDTAENAARKSTFTPTTLSGEKVKVRGLILYNFN